MKDFRSDPMPSPDGRGNAKEAFQRAWAMYRKAAEPAVAKLALPGVRSLTFDLYGFWLAWHLEGGFEGLQRPQPGGLGMSRSAVYRRIALFRRLTGKHPDEYQIPGVSLDVEEYLRGAAPTKDDKEN